MPKQTVKLQLRDVKKGSVRYDAAPDAVDPIVTNIYASKLALPRSGGGGGYAYPETVTVTVEWED